MKDGTLTSSDLPGGALPYVVMAVSRRFTLALCGIVAGVGLLVATAMTSAIAGAPASDPGVSGCRATARVDAQWGTGTAGGQVLTVTITNTAATTAAKWTVAWTLGAGQRVVSAWNATVSATGTTVTAVNAAHNGVLAPTASTTFGMQLSGIAGTPAPSCGNDTSTSPTAGTTPPGGHDVTVTQADNQRNVTLIVGQTLGIALGPDFVTPTVNSPTLERLSTSGGYPTGRPLTASYRAVAAGSTDITTHTDYACLHTSPPCALPTTLWTLHVTVVDGPDTGQTVTVSTADNLSTVRLRVGDTLAVNLPSAYLPPRVTTSGIVVQRDVTGGYPTGQPLVARYLAAAAGQTDVSTQTDDPCNHLPTPCPSPTVRWTIHIIVATT
jgi:hypothetical protein